MQSVTSILDGKAPVDGGTSLIAFLFERMDMSPQVSLIRDTLSQTTTAEHAQGVRRSATPPASLS